MVTETGTREEFLPSQARGVIKNRPQEQGAREAKALAHSCGVVRPSTCPGSPGKGPGAPGSPRGAETGPLAKRRTGKESLCFPPPLGGSRKETAKPEEQSGVPEAAALRDFSRADGTVRGCLWEAALGPCHTEAAGGTERAWGAKRGVSGCALDPFLRFCLELDGLRVSSHAATRCDLKIQ